MRKMTILAALACLCAVASADAAQACSHWGGRGSWGGCGWGGGYYYNHCRHYSCCYGPVYYYYGCYGGTYYAPGYYGGPVYMPVYNAASATPSAAPATLVVTLPADAVLTVDGKATSSKSGLRIFETPALAPGTDFEYTLEARVNRNGQEQVLKQRVTVRAGQQTAVRMDVPAVAAGE
jgi:uncharacterized protein (TIGR03000 family)